MANKPPTLTGTTVERTGSPTLSGSLKPEQGELRRLPEFCPMCRRKTFLRFGDFDRYGRCSYCNHFHDNKV